MLNLRYSVLKYMAKYASVTARNIHTVVVSKYVGPLDGPPIYMTIFTEWKVKLGDISFKD